MLYKTGTIKGEPGQYPEALHLGVPAREQKKIRFTNIMF